ncbi:hypothetical protein [Kingella pumchi]|uniref:Uncharacterized protein n=1 Tax=Kingella pumchi TaxID=2779506 RepID=A0ABS9NPG3_9NEIS|nr:hypothetical protein [Kingella pumchi]MCG6504687.1 hypothetical protein [Kingella pumchi]
MPIWLIKHWRPLAAAAVLAILAGLWHTDRAHQYRRGAEDTAASIKAKLAEQAAAQTAAARNTERKQADSLAAAQVKIEKERQDAQTVITDMRRELDRLRRHTETAARRATMPAAGQTARPSDGADAAAGWLLLGQCAQEYADLAETADAQRNDLAEWQAYGAVVASEPR